MKLELREPQKDFEEATIVLLVRENGGILEVLLAKKTRHVGVGKWNGAGGKIKPGETHREGAARETGEELGVIVNPANLRHVAVIDFHNTMSDGTIVICRVWVYLLYQWEGESHETEDGGLIDPTWFPRNHLPAPDTMMPGDPRWFPCVLAGGKIYCTIPYGPGQESLNGPVVIRSIPPDMQE
jgi:8-oxo-dGTP diphosphatase